MSTDSNAWVEVDLGAIKHNVKRIQSLTEPNVKLMAVVKANAYGHGAVQTSKALIEAGTDALAVTRLDEAVRLRNAGILSPILVLDSIHADDAPLAVQFDLDLTICTHELLRAIASAQRNNGKRARVHLKIDTGLGRLGVAPEDACELARAIVNTDGVELSGVYTHFATASDKNLSETRHQLKSFNDAINAIRSSGINPKTIHAANSSAIIRLPESHFDMVRPGTLIYGQYPSSHVPRSLDLRNTWTLKTRISFVKTVSPGSSIGYGSEFQTRRTSRIAVIPLGWADGLTLAPLSLANRGLLRLFANTIRRQPALTVLVHGKKAPVVGRIAMQMCSVDVTDIPEADIGDTVVVPSRRVTTSALIPRVYR